MSFGTEQEFSLSHVFLFAISGYIKIGSFGFRIKKFNTLKDEDDGSCFGLSFCLPGSWFADTLSKTSAVPFLPILLRFWMGTAGVIMLRYNERSSSRV